MLQGVALVNARRWAAARALLARVETRGLEPELSKHVHHLRATASLHVGGVARGGARGSGCGGLSGAPEAAGSAGSTSAGGSW